MYAACSAAHAAEFTPTQAADDARALPVTAVHAVASAAAVLTESSRTHVAAVADVGSITAAHAAVSAATGTVAVSSQMPAAVVKKQPDFGVCVQADGLSPMFPDTPDIDIISSSERVGEP